MKNNIIHERNYYLPRVRSNQKQLNETTMKTSISKPIQKIVDACKAGSTLFINENWTRAELYNGMTDEKRSVSISVCSQIQNHNYVQMQQLNGWFSGGRAYKIIERKLRISI